RLIVQLVRDAPDLLFEELVEAAERGVGFADAPVRHLERRETFEDEITRRLHDAQALVGGLGVLAGLQHRMVQERGDVEHAEAVSDRLAPKVVGTEQASYLAGHEIVVEGLRELLAPRDRCFRHARAPTYRATTTRASSVVLPWSARMRSALGGGRYPHCK